MMAARLYDGVTPEELTQELEAGDGHASVVLVPVPVDRLQEVYRLLAGTVPALDATTPEPVPAKAPKVYPKRCASTRVYRGAVQRCLRPAALCKKNGRVRHRYAPVSDPWLIEGEVDG